MNAETRHFIAQRDAAIQDLQDSVKQLRQRVDLLAIKIEAQETAVKPPNSAD